MGRAIIFQYLKGAIRRAPPETRDSTQMVFQYLKGAIRSGVIGPLLEVVFPAFNTSKVRLGGRPTRQTSTNSTTFNTSKVRLGAVPDSKIDTKRKGFQYLKGAIRRSWGDSQNPYANSFQYLKGAIRSLWPSPVQGLNIRLSIPQRCD